METINDAHLPEVTGVWSPLKALHCLIWYLFKTPSQGMTSAALAQQHFDEGMPKYIIYNFETFQKY